MMTVPESYWIRFIDMLAAIDNTAARKFAAFLRVHPISTTNDRRLTLDYAAALVQRYGESAAAVACQMYDAIAEAEGIAVPAAEPALGASYGEVAKTINGIMKESDNPDYISSGISRLVKQQGVDTTMQNAIRDGAEWAWIPHGDTCAFCITLASRGWQRASKKTLKNGHAEHIHANCDCTYAVRFSKDTRYVGYDPDKYLEVYENAEGSTPKEKIKSIRHNIEAEKRETAKGEEERLKSPIVTDTPKRVENPTYGHRDVTNDWLKKAIPNSHPVTDVETFVQDGITYTVDGDNVKFIYEENEKRIAELFAHDLGGDIRMMPKIEKPDGKQTPDFIFRGQRYDLKTPEKINKNTFFNAVHNKREQANNFVFDISKNGMSIEQAVNQIEGLYTSKYTTFIERVVLVKNGKVIRVYEREK